MSEFEIGRLGDHMKENGGLKSSVSSAIQGSGLRIGRRGDVLADDAAAQSAVEVKPKRGRKPKADEATEG